MKKSSFLTGLIVGLLICLGIMITAGYFVYEKFIAPLASAQQAAAPANKYVLPSQVAQQQMQSPANVLDALNKMIAANPSNANAYLQKADILAQLGEYDEAIRNYDYAAALDSNNPQIYLNRSMAKFSNGDFAGAGKDLTAAIKLDPELAKAYHNRGVVNVNMANMNAALQDFAKARELFGKVNDRANFAQADQALKAVNNYVAAVKQNGMQQRGAPKVNQIKNNPKELVTSARTSDNSAKYKSDLTASLAGSDTKGMLEKFRNASVQADGSQPALGDLSSYAAAASQALAQKQQNMPKNTLDYRVDAQKKLSSGDYSGAVKDFDKALELSPQDSNLYAQRGMANAAMQNSKEAIADFDRAIAANPQNASAFFNRAQQRSLMGDNKGALKDLESAKQLYEEQGNAKGAQQAENLSNTLQNKAVKTTKNDTEAERLLKEGTNSYSKGDYNGALKNFDELIKRQPKVPELYYNRAITNSALGKYDDALKDYKATIARNPNMPDAYIGAASVLLHQGKAEEAKTNIAKALELNPDNPGAYRMRAMQLAQEGDTKNAMNDFNKALGLDPDDGASYLSRGVLKAQDNNLEQGLQDVARARELAEKQGNAQLLKEAQKYEEMIEQALAGSQRR